MSLDPDEQRRAEARKIYTQGLHFLQDENYQSAGEYINRAAEMGDSTAQCQLGFLYENGFFGAPDSTLAAHWYKKSADQMLPHAQFRLGACYQLGSGIEQNREEAARLFNLAAQRGHCEAAEALKMLRDMGIEIPARQP